MAPEVYIPLLSALAGALIGTVGTIAVVIVQTVSENRRHMREMSFNMASELRRSAIEFAMKGGGSVPPIEIFIAHTMRILKDAERGKLSPTTLAESEKELDELTEFIEARESRRSATKK